MLYPFYFQMKNKWQTFFKATMYLPAVASGVTISVVWLAIYDPTHAGLLNRFIGLFGLDPVIWLGKSNTALFSLILMNWLGSHGAGIILIGRHGRDSNRSMKPRTSTMPAAGPNSGALRGR